MRLLGVLVAAAFAVTSCTQAAQTVLPSSSQPSTPPTPAPTGIVTPSPSPTPLKPEEALTSGDPVELLTAELRCYLGGESPVTAQLVAHAEYGTAFDGKPVIWPLGYTARRAGDEVEVLDGAGTVRATTGRRYFIAQASVGSPYPETDAVGYPAAVDCDWPQDFGECDASGEPVLPPEVTPKEHEEAVAAYC